MKSVKSVIADVGIHVQSAAGEDFDVIARQIPFLVTSVAGSMSSFPLQHQHERHYRAKSRRCRYRDPMPLVALVSFAPDEGELLVAFYFSDLVDLVVVETV
jgi:hypothetical protein